MSNHYPTIISKCDDRFKSFIELAVSQFFKELYLYTEHNSDPVLLAYANERTLCSLLVNGIIRDDAERHLVTAIEEYKIYFEQEKKYGRPDVFIRWGETAIWVESKFDTNPNLDKNH